MIKLSGSSINKTGSKVSLPVIIKISQYNKEWQKGWIDSLSNPDTIAGSFGDKQFEFFVDCRHLPLNAEDETVNMQYINNKLTGQKNPVFLKSDILDRFYVLEVGDYGRQSMSARFRDFTPHVYYKKDGDNYSKIPQKYIGVMKYYLTGSAYILIDKDYLGKDSNDAYIEFNKSNAVILIYLKNNIENAFSDSKNIKKENDNKISKIYLDEDITEYSFISKDANTNKNKNVITDLDAGFISNLTISSTANVIEKQYENKNEGEVEEDYFKQSYKKDYLPLNLLENIAEEYDRPVDAKYKISYKLGNGITTISEIKSKENNYDAIYFKPKDGSENITSIPLDDLKGLVGLSNPDEISIYDTTTGKKLIYLKDYHFESSSLKFENSAGYSEIELIPAYSDHTILNRCVKVNSTISSNIDMLSLIKAYAYMNGYRNISNYKESDYLIFNADGYLLTSVNALTEDELYGLTVYNINKHILDGQSIPDTENNFTDNILKNNNDENINKLSWFKDNIFIPSDDNVTVLKASPGILAYNENGGIVNDDLNIYLVARSFPIRMEKYKLLNGMVLFVAPKFILDNTNTDLSDTLESDVIVDGTITNIKFISRDTMNYRTNCIDELDNILATTNIVNSTRDILKLR